MRITAWTSRFGLPLLRELTEQAARRRTYVIRVLYAGLLFTAGCLLFADALRVAQSSPVAALGRGKQMFEALMGLQFAGVYLFMPAITCGVLTQEKERNSLMLLFLTKLGPWTILFEKLLSRAIPMGCFLLASLPLLAYAYTLGGITQEQLWTGVWTLFVSVVQTGTLALMCSAYFRTTSGAFVGSYVLGFVMCFGPFLIALPFLMGTVASLSTMIIAFPFFPPFPYMEASGMGSGAVLMIASSIPTLFLSVGMLVVARACIVTRAFLPPRNRLRELFQSIDRLVNRANDNRLTRGIVLIPDRGSLPGDQPVAWRETTKRSLGQLRYLVRILIATEGPVIVVCAFVTVLEPRSMLAATSILIALLWIFAMLALSVQSASLIAAERTQQTLDVLCATPLAGRRILLEKFRGVQRMIRVLWLPFLTLFLLGSPWHGERGIDMTSYWTTAILSLAIYLPLCAWLSCLVGLVVKTQARAVVAALGAIVGWCVLPLVFVSLPLEALFGAAGHAEWEWEFSMLLSPATIISVNEFGEPWTLAQNSWVVLILNFLMYGSLLFFIRRWCLNNADRWLGRLDDVEPRLALAGAGLHHSSDEWRPVEARKLPVSSS